MKSKLFSLKTLIYLYLILSVIIITFPLIYAIGGSVKPLNEFLVGGTNIFPKESWDFQNYIKAWKGANFGRYTVNSILYAGFSVILTIISTSMTGFALSRYDFPGKKILQGTFGFMMFLIGAVTIYPLFILGKNLGLLNSIWGLVIVQVASGQPIYCMLVMGYCNGITKEIDESAKLDGATDFQTYFHILLPIIKPILATVGLLTFRDAWNNFMVPLAFTIAKPEIRPLTVGVVMLKYTGEGVTAWNLMLAGTVMSIVPILIVYIFTNKFFIKGITDGAIKG